MRTPSHIDTAEIAKLAPLAWSDLLTFTDETISNCNGLPFGVPEVAKVYERVERLGDSALEDAYYFGLRPAAVGLSDLIRDPGVQQDIAQAAATKLYNSWQAVSYGNPAHRRFRVADLRMPKHEDPVRPYARQANERVPLNWRMLADILTVATVERRTVQGERAGRQYGKDRPPSPESQFAGALTGLPTELRVSESGIATSLLLIQNVLCKLYEHAGGTVELTPDGEPMIPLTEAMQGAVLSTKRLGRIGLRCGATFRLDLLGESMKRCVDIDAAREPEFVSGQVPARGTLPQPKSGSKVSGTIHRCPGVYAGDLIPNMVRTATAATGEVDQMITGTEAASVGAHSLEHFLDLIGAFEAREAGRS